MSFFLDAEISYILLLLAITSIAVTGRTKNIMRKNAKNPIAT